ncbi:MAG: AMP-dependent synthetase/ligase [Calditrichia bacterium]
MEKKTIPHLLERAVRLFPDAEYVWEKRFTPEYVPYTFAQVREMAQQIGAGLIALGMKKGDRVALLSEGRVDWIAGELGVFYAGGTTVPLSIKLLEPGELKFRLIHAGCRYALLSESQQTKILELKNDLPDLDYSILFDDEGKDPDELSLTKLKEMGKKLLKEKPEEFEKRWTSVEEEDIAVISYTSGTTANPKGIMLMQKNFIANVEQIKGIFTLNPGEKIFLVIPWDHSFAHTCGLYATMHQGAGLAAVEFGRSPLEALKNFPKNIKEIKPEYMLSVPVLTENLKKNIEKGIKMKGDRIYKLFRKALKTNYLYIRNGWDKGKTLKQKLLLPQIKLYDALLFSKIRQELGGNMKFFVGGGAVLDAGLQRFFYAIGIPVYQGYGLTEAAPVISSNYPEAHKIGSSGRPIPGVEVKIMDEEGNEVPEGEKGEIWVRGENVMKGYWKNQEETRATLVEDGWLRTGDLGYIDSDGFLFVLGRVKSLLISANGEKYSPESIEESLINNSPYIDQVLLYNDHKPYTVALFYPNLDAIKEYLKENNLTCDDEESCDQILTLFQREVDRYKEGGDLEGMYPVMWLPSTFGLLGEGFTEQNGFLNSSLKMVRTKIVEYYKDRIDYLYSPEGRNIYNHRNRNIIRKLLHQ